MGEETDGHKQPTSRRIRSNKTREQRTKDFAIWVAEVSIIAGLTLRQAMDHSVSQLYLLHEAATRIAGRDGLRALHAGTAAAALAHSGKSAKGYWDETRKHFSRQAGI